MPCKAPGKHFRKGLSAKKFFKLFPDDAAAAEQWFIQQRWPHGIACHGCGSLNVQPEPSTRLCHFVVGIAGINSVSRLGLRCKAPTSDIRVGSMRSILLTTNLKSVSSMKLHRELDITQRSAWHLAHRIRNGMEPEAAGAVSGPVEADETYMGGKRRNMPKSKRAGLEGRGPIGKTALSPSRTGPLRRSMPR